MSAASMTAQPANPDVRDRQMQLNRILYWAFFILGLAWSLYTWAQSTGTPLDDEITHVIVARASWTYPEFLLDIWMRAANSLLWVVPGQFGINGMRAFTLFLSILIVLMSTDIARRYGVRWLFLIPLFLWFQPWMGMVSWPATKNVPFMFFLMAGFWLWQKDRLFWAAFMIGMLPLSRHEGIALSGLWFLWMLVNRKWWAALGAWIPIIIYNALFLAVHRVPFDSLPIAIYLRPQGSGYYGSGSWFHFVPQVAAAVGIPVTIWAIIGLRRTLRLRSKAIFFLMPAAYFMIHTVIFRFGLYESGGYVVFLLALAPAFAIMGALGADQILDRFPNIPRIGVMLAVIVPVLIMGGVATLPFKKNASEIEAGHVARWLQEQNIPESRVYSTYPWINMEYNVLITPAKKYITGATVKTLAIGDILIWDKRYSEVNGISLRKLQEPDNGLTQLAVFDEGGIVIFRVDRVLTDFEPQITAQIVQTEGLIESITVQEVGKGFGSGDEFFDVDVLFKIAGSDAQFGFKLRNDHNSLTHAAMLDLLRDALNGKKPILIDYDKAKGGSNFEIIRVTLKK